MRAGRAIVFTVGAVLVAYAALRIVNGVVKKNGGSAFLPDPLAPLLDKISSKVSKK